jgi:hypothetical protein
MAMFERRDRLYAELGVPPEEPEDALDRWRRMRVEREEPAPRERVVPPTLAEIDRRITERIAAENELTIALMAENNVELKREWKMGAMGPPGPAGPRGEQGPPGKLPLVKLWVPETVYYEGDVVTHGGGTWQATKDTGQQPGRRDWICLAMPGFDGKGFAVRGTYNTSLTYVRHDVVALNGGSFIALKDAPGPCPGPGWQLLASQGKRGVAGEKGERGPQGSPGLSGAAIRDWKIDRERYVATPVMSDGREGPPLELRGLFEQFLREAR